MWWKVHHVEEDDKQLHIVKEEYATFSYNTFLLVSLTNIILCQDEYYTGIHDIDIFQKCCV